MQTQNKIICIFGGTGFLGRHITQELARAGYRLKIATRIPESAYDLKPYGDIGQITPFQCNYHDPASIDDAVKGCYAVINLIGVLYEKGKNSFTHAHHHIPESIARVCAVEGVKKFIHVSAMGVENAKNAEKAGNTKNISKYLMSKLAGEKAIQEHYKGVTILRPSVVFGAGDSFFNMFAKLSCVLPFLPLIGGGKTKFQPVYVGDIADSILNIMQEKSDKFEGKIYELGGPEVVSFREIYEITLSHTNRRTKLVSLPWGIAKIQGAVFGLMPKPFLTLDQVKSLRFDNVMTAGAQGLADLGVEPTAMGTILPEYLICYRRGGRFANKKTA